MKSGLFYLTKRYILFFVSSLLLITIVRVLFWKLNISLFPVANTSTTINIFLGGLKFDISAICMLHIILLPFFFIPKYFLDKKFVRVLSFIILIIIGIALLTPSFIDIVYYRFTFKRLTFDIFSFIGSIKDEMGGLSLRFLFDFWFYVALYFVFIGIYIFSIRYFLFSKKNKLIKLKYFHQLISALIFTTLIVIGSRGSLGIRPLGIINAPQAAGYEYSPIVLNSTFTLIKTYGKKDIEKKNWFSEYELNNIYNPIHCYFDSTKKSKDCNVVLFICESLSSEHIGFFNNGLQSYTPFIDSLCERSLVFTNMFANGKRSIDGLPAIISSLPPLMKNSFSTSMYSSNNIEGIANMLRFESSFFHGGHNGTMNFHGLSASAGYKKYFGKDEYIGASSDFDGHWGIFDEPFLQFFANKCKEFKQPFSTCLFTLSAHHPYTIPSKYKNRFIKGPKPILETISYFDFALKRFFDTAKKMSWYKNTLFIITSDHTSELYSNCYNKYPVNHSIPMIWFCPFDTLLKGKSDILCQQTDILPSIADYMNTKDTIIAFGNSVFDTTAYRFLITMDDSEYQLVTKGNKVTFFDGVSVSKTKVYSICKKENITKVGTEDKKDLNLLKAIIQQYNNRLILNKLTIK